MTDAIGPIPYRMAFAGGWIDQPFVSRLNPDPTGSMVVVSLRPTFRWMERAGMATGTRKVIERLWGRLPDRTPAELVRELYRAENEGKAEPSGSQDMIGLIYPGVSRLDYSADHEGGLFPKHIETTTDPAVAAWVEQVVHVLPVAPRPPGYNPLGEKRVTPDLARELGRTGRDCYAAIVNRDLAALGDAMNRCMACWAEMLPHVVRHETIDTDLPKILKHYQERHAGAMYSGCGGGYLYVVSDDPVPGAFKVQVRTT